MIPTNYYIVLSAILFGLGVLAFIFKRNIISIFMSIELMLNAVNLAFVAFSQARGQNVHVIGPVRHVVFGKVYGRAIERVGLDHITADIEKPGMYFFDGVGAGDQQMFVTAFEPQAAKIIQRKVLHLQIGAHRAIKDDDAFF